MELHSFSDLDRARTRTGFVSGFLYVTGNKRKRAEQGETWNRKAVPLIDFENQSHDPREDGWDHEFCVLCKYVFPEDDYAVEGMHSLLTNNLGLVSLRQILTDIQKMYNKHLKPVANKRWSKRAIFEHFFRHEIIPQAQNYMTKMAVLSMQRIMEKNGLCYVNLDDNNNNNNKQIDARNASMYLKLVHQSTRLLGGNQQQSSLQQQPQQQQQQQQHQQQQHKF